MPLPELCFRCHKLKDPSLGKFIWRHRWDRKRMFCCDNCEDKASVTRHRAPSRSPLEREALRVLVNFGLPFDQEKPIENFFYDFCVPGLNLLVEVDSPSYHDYARRKRVDRIKDAVAKRLGWKLVRVREPDLVGKLQAALDERYNEVGLSPT